MEQWLSKVGYRLALAGGMALGGCTSESPRQAPIVNALQTVQRENIQSVTGIDHLRERRNISDGDRLREMLWPLRQGNPQLVTEAEELIQRYEEIDRERSREADETNRNVLEAQVRRILAEFIDKINKLKQGERSGLIVSL